MSLGLHPKHEQKPLGDLDREVTCPRHDRPGGCSEARWGAGAQESWAWMTYVGAEVAEVGGPGLPLSHLPGPQDFVSLSFGVAEPSRPPAPALLHPAAS